MSSKVDQQMIRPSRCSEVPSRCLDADEYVVSDDPFMVEDLEDLPNVAKAISCLPTLVDSEIQIPHHGMIPQRINCPVGKASQAQSSQLGYAPHRKLSLSCNFEKKLSIDVSALQDLNWARRKDAVANLGACSLGRHPGEFNQEAANIIMPALRAAMRDEHWQVRAQAATSLSDLGPEAVWHAVPVLWETCSDPDEAVRQAALQALRVHGQETPPEHLQQARLRCRPWQEPPSLKAVREDAAEDQQSGHEDLSTTDHSGTSSRESSKCSTRDIAGDPTCVSEFTMLLGKLNGIPLGIDVDYTKGDGLRVLSVNAGFVCDWNQSQDLWKLEAEDWIHEVNGRRGSAMELMNMLKRDVFLEVVVRRELQDLEEYSYI